MRKWPFGVLDGVGYLVCATALVAITAWGVDRKSTPVWLLAAVAGGVVYATASGQYRTWALARRDPWYWRQSLLAGVGIAVNAFAAALLQHASTVNDPALAAVGVAVLITGFMPVMHVVRTDINPVRQPPIRYVYAWLLNLVVIGLALVPGMRIVGASWWAAIGISAAWFASALVDRVGHHGWYKLVVGACAVGIVLCAALVMVPEVEGRSSSAVAWTVAGAVAALLGLVDAASARFRSRPGSAADTRARSDRLAVALGVCAVATVSTTFWLVPRLGGVRWQIQALVIVGMLAFGASFLVRGQGFAVVALLGGLVVWTVTDRTDPAPVDPWPAESGTIVALGDSYIAGEGSQLFFDETNVEGHNNCRRSSAAFPYLVAAEFHKHLVFAACSGAVARQVWDVGQIAHPREHGPIGSLPQLDNDFPDAPDLVLISIGGNDALFGEIGKGCAFPGSCTELSDTFDGNLANVRAAVGAALEEVGRRFPASPVVVVPYPQMLGEQPCRSAPLDEDELPYLRSFVDRLDTTVAAAVGDANARLDQPNLTWFAPGVAAYAGQELCTLERTEKVINVITLSPSETDDLADRINPTKWTHNSFHPTEAGHRRMAAALEAWLPGRFPGFIGHPQDEPAVAPIAGEPAPSPPTCAERSTCQDEVDSWMAAQAVTSLRLVFLPLLALLATGWLASFAVRRYRTTPPRV